MVSLFALRRVEFRSLLSLSSLIRPLGWVLTVLLRVALNSVSGLVVVGDMKEMMMTRMADFKGCLCLFRGDRRANGEMTLEAVVPIKKGWVERTEAAKSSIDIDRGWVNSDQSGNTWGSNVQRSITVFDMLITYHFQVESELVGICRRVTVVTASVGIH